MKSNSSTSDKASLSSKNLKKNHNDGGLILETSKTKPFQKINFILMAVCLGMIILGFALMAGPGSSVETGFNPDVFSTRRIIVGPLFAFLGFLFMAFAIIYRPVKKQNSSND